MVAPVSVTLFADLSAQPVDNSVEPMVAAFAPPTPTVQMASTRANVTSALASRRALREAERIPVDMWPPRGSRRSGAGRPGHLRGVVVVDAHDVPAGTLSAEPLLERRPVVGADRRPAQLGDRRQSRERHVLDVGQRPDRLRPQWSFNAEYRGGRGADEVVARIPPVRLLDVDEAGPPLAEDRAGVVLHVEVGAVGRRHDEPRA